MTITKSNREELLRQLTRFAGDPTIVEDALKELSDREKPPTLDELLDKIIQIKQTQQVEGHADALNSFATVP